MNHHHINGPAGALPLVQLTAHGEVIDDVVLVVEVAVEARLRPLAVDLVEGRGLLERIGILEHLGIGSREQQHCPALTFQCPQRAERDGVIDLGGAIGRPLHGRHLRGEGLRASIAAAHTEGRIGHNHIECLLRQVGRGILRRGGKALGGERSQPFGVDLVRQHLAGVCGDQQCPVAGGGLIDRGVF